MKKERHDRMIEITSLIQRELLKLKKYARELNTFCSEEMEHTVFKTLENRLKKISVRSSFVFFKYDFLLQNIVSNEIHIVGEKRIIKLAFLMDAVMAVIYCHNHIYDKKNDFKFQKIGLDLGSANRLKDLIYEYVDRTFPEKALFINRVLRKAYADVDNGQMSDQQYNFKELISNTPGCSKMPRFLNENLVFVLGEIENLTKEYKEYTNCIEVYFARIYLISSSLFKSFDEILIELIGINRKNNSTLIQVSLAYSEVYGLLMQIVNDTNDFVYDLDTSNKKSCDVLSDLHNQTVTLPLIFFMSSSFQSKLVKPYIYKRSVEEEYHHEKYLEGRHNEVLEEMIKSGALSKSIKFGKVLREICIKLLTGYKAINYLIDKTGITIENRYYIHVFKAKKAFRKGKVYRCEDNLSSKKQKVLTAHI